jgi:hypothetical protein
MSWVNDEVAAEPASSLHPALGYERSIAGETHHRCAQLLAAIVYREHHPHPEP